MMEAERKRPDGIDFVVITTPNHLHLPVALGALEAGIPVMSESRRPRPTRRPGWKQRLRNSHCRTG